MVLQDNTNSSAQKDSFLAKQICGTPVRNSCPKMSHIESLKITKVKGAIRARKSQDRQYNGQQKKDKRTSNDVQNTTQKTKDQAIRIPLKPV